LDEGVCFREAILMKMGVEQSDISLFGGQRTENRDGFYLVLERGNRSL
jgi:hypothetical protein